MDILTPINQALQWHEGMLLSPQHFQQNDIYWHQQLWHRAASLQPHCWGVLDMALSLDELQSGWVKIDRLHGILPDGLSVQIPNSCALPRFNLNDEQLKWSEQRQLKLYLAVPIRTEAAASSNSDIRRFSSLPMQPTRDENTGEGNVEVGRLAPRLELLPEEKCSGKYVAFPLLEVRREPGNRYVLTDYHPPLLRLSCSGFLDQRGLQKVLQKLAHALREKAMELIGDRRDDDKEPLGYGSPNLHYQLECARILTAALPAFEVMLKSGETHPFKLYLALAQLVGQVAAIGADPMPPLLSAYQHDDLMPAFLEAIAFIQQRLSRLQVGMETIFFKKYPTECAFTCEIPEDLLADKLHIELKPAAGQGRELLQEWLGKSRIASEDLMPILAERRLPGAQFKAVDPTRINGLQIRPDALVFEISNEAIDLKGRRTPLIRSACKLKIQGPHDMEPPTHIVLHRTRVRRGGSVPATSAQVAEARDGEDCIPVLSQPVGSESVDAILKEVQGSSHA